MALIDELPEGLIDQSDLGIMAEETGLSTDDDLHDLAELIIRAMSVLVRAAASQPDWTAATTPFEARIVVLNACRRVFNNPANQQRIQTGPLSESYSTDELTGLALTESEITLLETFADGESDTGLSVISVVRPDPLPPRANYEYAIMVGMFNNNTKTIIPSLSRYLGISNGA